jgi:4-amino-4-deoxy-L-arabinose transferase-like glycosyltransferase
MAAYPDLLPQSRARPLIIILVVAACVRLVLALLLLSTETAAPVVVTPDSAGYMLFAENLATTFSFGDRGVPEVFRTPGYPMLLAFASLTGHMLVTAVLIQIALGVATVGMVYGIAQGGGDDRLARVAAWTAAFDPLLVLFCSIILTETLFTTLLVGSLFVFLRRDVGSARGCILAALLASLAALVRPIAYFVPLLYATFALLNRRGPPWPARFGHAAAAVAIAAVVLGGWHVRNARVAGFSGFSAQSDRQLYFTSAVWAQARHEGRSFGEVREAFQADLARASGESNEMRPRFAAEARQRGLAFLKSNWAEVLQLQLAGTLVVLLQPPLAETRPLVGSIDERAGSLRDYALRASLGDVLTQALAERPSVIVWRALRVVYWGAFLALLAVGMVRLVRVSRLRRYLGATTGVLCAYLLLASGGYFGQARFRHPLMPIASIVAASGLCALGDRRLHRLRSRYWRLSRSAAERNA